MKTYTINSVNTHRQSNIFSKLYIAILAISYFLLTFPSTLLAQSYQEQKDALFQHLDKSKVTTGVLYDRVYPWVDLNVVKRNGRRVAFDGSKKAIAIKKGFDSVIIN